MTVHDTKLSRRTLLKAGAGLVIGAYVMRADKLFAQAAAQPKVNIAPNTFLIIKPDSTVTVLCKQIEFGQGPFTGFATLVAEELDADWSQMRADHAPSNPELYKNLAFGLQGTGGSTAIANAYLQMRQVGAAARQMLVAAAAEAWQVPRRDRHRERCAQACIRQGRPVWRIRRQGDDHAGAGGSQAERSGELQVHRQGRRGEAPRQRR